MSNVREKVLVSFPSILIALIPLFLITGPFLSDLSVVLVSIFFLINISLKKEFLFLKNKFFLIFVIFFLYLLLNSIVKYYDIHNLRSSLGYIRFGLFSLAVFYFINQNEKILNWVFYVFLFCFLILIIDGFIQFIFKENMLNTKANLNGRISSLFGAEHVMGSYLSRLFPIFLGITFFLFKDKKQYIFFISIVFVLVEVLIFLSGERAAFFFNTLSAIFIVLMIKDFKKVRLLCLVISFSLITLITMIDDSAKKRIWDSTIDQIGFNSDKLNIFSEVHESHYKSAYKMYLENQIIGIGIRNFRNFCHETRFNEKNERSCTTHPHNTYVQFLSELGLVGFSFLISVFILFIYFCLKHLYGVTFKKKYFFTDFEICLMAAILISIWPFVPTGNFFNNWISIIYYYPVGFLLWSFNRKRL